MKLEDRFFRLYRRLRLVSYRRLLRRTEKLSAADAFAVDVIYLLERPTLSRSHCNRRRWRSTPPA